MITIYFIISQIYFVRYFTFCSLNLKKFHFLPSTLKKWIIGRQIWVPTRLVKACGVTGLLVCSLKENNNVLTVSPPLSGRRMGLSTPNSQLLITATSSNSALSRTYLAMMIMTMMILLRRCSRLAVQSSWELRSAHGYEECGDCSSQKDQSWEVRQTSRTWWPSTGSSQLYF